MVRGGIVDVSEGGRVKRLERGHRFRHERTTGEGKVKGIEGEGPSSVYIHSQEEGGSLTQPGGKDRM